MTAYDKTLIELAGVDIVISAFADVSALAALAENAYITYIPASFSNRYYQTVHDTKITVFNNNMASFQVIVDHSSVPNIT